MSEKYTIQDFHCPSQSPDVNPVKVLWQDLKGDGNMPIHKKLKQRCKEEWAKVPPQPWKER